LSSKRKRSLPRRILRACLLALLAWVALGVVAVALLRFMPPVASSVMLQDWIGARVAGDDAFVLRYRWTPWKDVAPGLPISLVAAEDQKFFAHRGFDVASIRDALSRTRNGVPTRGASTITQQVAKNLWLWPGRSWLRKGLEAYLTVWVELLWPKERILEVYLNVIEWGDGVYGVDAASREYFNRPASQLTARQAALLAAVLPNPRMYSPAKPSSYVARRASRIQAGARIVKLPFAAKEKAAK
jgi:monofunctional biosynthetic peptidoglycan transglycosylase